MNFRSVLVFLLLVIIDLSFPSAEPVAQPRPSAMQSPLGTNLGALVDWSDDIPLLDLFKLSRHWLPQCQEGRDPGCSKENNGDTDESEFIDVDADGWVRSLPTPSDGRIFTYVTTLMLLGDNRLDFSGQYVVLYDGDGTIVYEVGASKDTDLSVPGRDVINVSSDGNVVLKITATDPQHTGNYIRNIRVVRAEHEDTFEAEVFNPDFLERLEPVSMLRFMDWMRTNDSTQSTWANRPHLTDARYTTDAGAPLELMLDLANRTGTSPWFNMPHMATDDYVTQFAQLTQAQLHSDARVYVEYSNETWNGLFQQASYVNQQGMAAFGSRDEFQSGLNWHGRRAAEICDIWKTVWGDQASRVVCVAAAQAANSWTSEQVLDCPLWTAGAPCSDHGIDVLAIAPYFGGYLGDPSTADTVDDWTLDQVFAELGSGGQLSGGPIGGAIAKATDWMQASASVAATRSVRLVTYEGGQHLVGYTGAENNQALTDLLIAANRDPRMGALYTQYLNNWRASGGSEFMNFSFVATPSKWGSWGALEYVTQPDTPKWTALVNWAEVNPCWWEGCITPPLQ